jgi:hypothetical protein
MRSAGHASPSKLNFDLPGTDAVATALRAPGLPWLTSLRYSPVSNRQ